MVSVRRRRKQKSSLPKITRKRNDKQRKVRIKSNAIIAANWDEKLTLSQNYKKLGLTSRLSKPTGGIQKELKPATAASPVSHVVSGRALESDTINPSKAITEAKIVRDAETGAIIRIEEVKRTEFDDVSISAPTSSTTDVVRQLEEYAARGERKVERTQSEREDAWIEELVSKHGDDYEAMMKDRKLNIWQQSAGDIRRRVEKWKKNSRSA
ncbi:ribosome biogenesis protein Nop16 [Lipomyces chichibuensis]|uniref:ribosome biogenesis protein Nop16 n=1 Tax=Lipomyces chichibuensis TaxID=1546026 RepID=UPI003343B54A